MATTFLDLLRVKVAIQLGALDAATAVRSLQHLDNGGVEGGFLGQLTRSGASSEAVARVDRYARRCLEMRQTSFYLGYLRQRNVVDEQALHPVMWEVRGNPGGPGLGATLVARGLLPAQLNEEIKAQAHAALDAENQTTALRYRERGYEGVEAVSPMIARLIAEGEGSGSGRVPAQQPASPPGPPVLGGEGTQILTPGQASGVVPMAAAVQAAPPLPPALANSGLDEKYVVLRKLGEGGMGEVYLAFAKDDPRRERPMALKVVLDTAKSKDAAERFKREILATSMCAHENIIEIYDASETKDGSYYMAMEYFEGEELSDILKRERQIALPRVVELMEQCLAGMEAMHQAEIIHRDIKPHNFRITKRPDGSEQLKIVDFGIARILGMDGAGLGDQIFMTMAGKITGSPAYIAPESITEPEVDGRADLYSLGISIFRITTGRLPFVAREPSEYLPMHLYNKPPPLRTVLPDAPQEMEDFVAKLLEKLPTKRFESAGAALEVLKNTVRPAVFGSAPVPDAYEDLDTITQAPPGLEFGGGPNMPPPDPAMAPTIAPADSQVPQPVTAADLGFTQDTNVEEFDPTAQDAIAEFRAKHGQGGEGTGTDLEVGETTAEVEGMGPTGRVAEKRGFFARMWAAIFGG